MALFEAPNPAYLGNVVQQLLIDTPNKYNHYRLFCLEAETNRVNPGLSHMQLYVYSE